VSRRGLSIFEYSTCQILCKGRQHESKALAMMEIESRRDYLIYILRQPIRIFGGSGWEVRQECVHVSGFQAWFARMPGGNGEKR
jgi:hypothetical protein